MALTPEALSPDLSLQPGTQKLYTLSPQSETLNPKPTALIRNLQTLAHASNLLGQITIAFPQLKPHPWYVKPAFEFRA